MWKEMKGREEVNGMGGKEEDMNLRKRPREGRRLIGVEGREERMGNETGQNTQNCL